MDVRHIATVTHGRFLVESGSPERLLVGFHGYAENAEAHMNELMRIPGREEWTLVAVNALNRFYTRAEQTVGSWMTSQDRELAIADNLAYVQGVLGTFSQPRTLVFAGFSQGVAMAFRAAAAIVSTTAVIAIGGDVPPDVDPLLPPVLLARGVRDEWYSEEKMRGDLERLSGGDVTRVDFDGAHEWTDEVRAAAGRFLTRFLL
jgi:predicted esterase